MTKRGFILVVVFGVGVGLGCAAAPLVVPKASAQQAAALSKWEYSCADTPDVSTGPERKRSQKPGSAGVVTS